jgi:hypothetical protein
MQPIREWLPDELRDEVPPAGKDRMAVELKGSRIIARVLQTVAVFPAHHHSPCCLLYR